MQRQQIDSTMIRSVGWDGTTETLEVEFRNGGIYHYPCDCDLYNAFLCSPSKGQFFHARIRPLEATKVSA